jgi:DNA invertase Pin-like site-specific DNA recombinase
MTETQPMRAVAFAAKSTEDLQGSIATQLDDARALAEREGLHLVAEFHDEAASAYRRDRGPNLARTLAECERLAYEHGSCALIVQHSDRLARGDGRQAKHLVEYALWALKSDVTIHSVQDPQTFGDLLYAVVTGQRNHEDSARKSSATRDGLRRRKERGQPVGPLPLGYRVEHEMVDGRPVARRVIDPVERATVERIFDLIEAGRTPGQVARTLNAEGRLTKRGKAWTPRPVRRMVENDAYAGSKNYPSLIERERWERVEERLRRLDPAAVQRRKGGRATAADDYLLRGVAFCAHCGSALYTRGFASGRHYLCGNVRQATGLCDAARIPAELAESQVLNHLHEFVGSVEKWLSRKADVLAAEHDARKATVDREKAVLTDLDRDREKHLVEYRRMVAAGDRLARLALEEVDRLDGERAAQQEKVGEAEAVAAEFQGPPDIDAALDFYNGLVELVQGRVRNARGATELNAALHEVVAGIWFELEVEPEGERLLADFQLRTPRDVVLPGGVPIHPLFKRERESLPPMRPGTPLEEPAIPGHTPSYTTS